MRIANKDLTQIALQGNFFNRKHDKKYLPQDAEVDSFGHTKPKKKIKRGMRNFFVDLILFLW